MLLMLSPGSWKQWDMSGQKAIRVLACHVKRGWIFLSRSRIRILLIIDATGSQRILSRTWCRRSCGSCSPNSVVRIAVITSLEEGGQCCGVLASLVPAVGPVLIPVLLIIVILFQNLYSFSKSIFLSTSLLLDSFPVGRSYWFVDVWSRALFRMHIFRHMYTCGLGLDNYKALKLLFFHYQNPCSWKRILELTHSTFQPLTVWSMY